MLLGHKGPSALLHPKQVGEGLTEDQPGVNLDILTSRETSGEILSWWIFCLGGSNCKVKAETVTCPGSTSDLWCLVVHRGDGDVEDKVGDGATMLVTDREDELDQQRLRADVLHRRHEGHFHVVHGMLGKEERKDGKEGDFLQHGTRFSVGSLLHFRVKCCILHYSAISFLSSL